MKTETAPDTLSTLAQMADGSSGLIVAVAALAAAWAVVVLADRLGLV